MVGAREPTPTESCVEINQLAVVMKIIAVRLGPACGLNPDPACDKAWA